ncbi:MAG: PKD domain-containing protein [Candidatus Bipolaricaulota bacterium]|nr:PKD domain-containing protein [Candidatus Bipolaricaulota bacterium]MDW8127071.1 PKD domain-containing protein [Candidatus Bipolaricaulota bacterium]
MQRLMRKCPVLLAFLGLVLFGCTPPRNLPPVPVVAVEPSQGEAPLFVRASAEESFDPDGTILVVRWDFGDGVQTEGLKIIHRYDQEGDFFVTAEVVDNQGLSTVVRLPVHVGVSYPLDVLEWHVEEFGGTRVYGRVKNIGDRRINLGRVAVRFYDEDWNFVEERSKVLGDLYPGMEQIFEVRSAYRPLSPGGAPNHTIYTEVIHADEL